MPDNSLWLLILIIALAIGFGVVNGFNDAANAIAASVGSRSLSPRSAVILAAICNMAGAATGLAVARTIGKGILVPEAISYLTVIAALAAVIIWGTGSPRRETLHVDDLADACIFLMDRYDESEMINIGSGEDISIKAGWEAPPLQITRLSMTL